MVLETRELQFKGFMTGSHASAPATLSLLPPSPLQVEAPPVVNGARPKNQLTIFYAGSVNVYDDIPEEKAHAIMLLAGNSVNGNMNQLLGALAAVNMPHFAEPVQKVRKLQQGSSASSQASLCLGLRSSGANFSPSLPKVSCPPVPSQVLPQARKASLTRFLQRRKERVLQQSMESAKKEESDFSVKNQSEERSTLKNENSVGSVEG